MGSSLSSYFEVYHRLLARRLEAAAAAASPAALARVSAELAEACAGSQHTYAHAQLLLSHLHARSAAAAASSSGDAGGAGGGGDAGGSGGGGGAFRRLSQDLEAAAAARHGGAAVWAMQPLFVPRGAGPGAREAVRLVSRALVLGAGGGAAGGAGVTQVRPGEGEDGRSRCASSSVAPLRTKHARHAPPTSNFSRHGAGQLPYP